MRRMILLGALVVVLLSASLDASPSYADSRDVPDDAGRGAYIHDSGLIVVGESVFVLPEHLRAEYATAYTLSQEAASDFGLPSVKDDAVVLPVISANAKAIDSVSDRAAAVIRIAEDSAQSEKAKVLLPDPEQVQDLLEVARVAEATLSFADVARANDQLFDLRSEFAEAVIWGSEIHQPSGTITLSVEQLTPGLADFIKKSFGTQLVRVRIAPHPEGSPAAGRQNDASPYYGGAKINNPNGTSCTDAFSWKISSTVKGMLTAGHCTPSGGTVKAPNGTTMGSVTSGSRENWHATNGTQYLTGQSAYRGDIALIQLSSSVSHSARIYTGGTTSTTSKVVEKMWATSPAMGEQYCVGGISSGQSCGWAVDAVNVNFVYDDGSTLRNGTRGYHTSKEIKPGDSGGSVFTEQANGKVWAKGITSGTGWMLWYKWHFFTDIRQAYSGFPGSLLTG